MGGSRNGSGELWNPVDGAREKTKFYLDGFDAKSEAARRTLLLAKHHVGQFGDGLQIAEELQGEVAW